jgi:hypothetical protein
MFSDVIQDEYQRLGIRVNHQDCLLCEEPPIIMKHLQKMIDETKSDFQLPINAEVVYHEEDYARTVLYADSIFTCIDIAADHHNITIKKSTTLFELVGDRQMFAKVHYESFMDLGH